jgi:TolB-like protein/Tfp pilus assembly protein PilF
VVSSISELIGSPRATRTQKVAPSLRKNSIAVLPFVNMSSDVEQDYFSDGISEELLSILTKIPELHVISRSSAFSYKGRSIKLSQVAHELSVTYILEGSVRKAGNRLRIAAQLSDARSDIQMWSAVYERAFDDIFAIQDEITAAVVKELKVKLLGPAPKVAAPNPKSYALYLQACYMSRKASAEGQVQSKALLEQALAIDPTYVAARVGLAYNYSVESLTQMRRANDGFPRARALAREALKIDPEEADAYALLGSIAMMYDKDLADAARHYERAMALEPTNLDIIAEVAGLLASLGRIDAAIALEEYVVTRDPVYPTVFCNLGLSYLCARRLDESIASFRTALSLSPSSIVAHSGIGLAMLLKGEVKGVIEEVKQEPSEVLRLRGLVVCHHALGQQHASDTALEELIEKHGERSAYEIASALAYRKEADRAFEWLAKAVEFRAPTLAFLPVNFMFASIRDDPRWIRFLETIGKLPSQLDAVELEIPLPLP